MKICVIGYSGSGKSTLARKLAESKGTDVLHLDAVHWLPDWQMRTREEKTRIIGEFLDTHDSWVIDGNYSKQWFDRRMEEADQIIVMDFNRFRCLVRVIKRYHHYKGKTRPDMGEGCQEKLDWEFIKWVLWDGRRKSNCERLRQIERKYPKKVTVLRSQRQINAFEEQMGLSGDS